VLIIKRPNCINTASGIVFSVSDRPVYRLRRNWFCLNLHTGRSLMENGNKWLSCPKHPNRLWVTEAPSAGYTCFGVELLPDRVMAELMLEAVWPLPCMH